MSVWRPVRDTMILSRKIYCWWAAYTLSNKQPQYMLQQFIWQQVNNPFANNRYSSKPALTAHSRSLIKIISEGYCACHQGLKLRLNTNWRGTLWMNWVMQDTSCVHVWSVPGCQIKLTVTFNHCRAFSGDPNSLWSVTYLYRPLNLNIKLLWECCTHSYFFQVI